MPLVRIEVRNEYGSGLPELYKEADREDPKAVLDAVAVSGLVGILRQLGDLAEFAADVFHGLQEQVMTAASRSHKMMLRVQAIEAALPPLEKAVLAQTNHLQFCYSAGSEWHPRIRNQRHHFIYNDLPQFIMDSYEECRDPPRLHLLDRFDTGGPGSCLKKYSDPTFFKRVSAISNGANAERRKDKKACKSKKKKRSWKKNGEFTHNTSVLSGSGRMQFTAPHNYFQPSPDQSQTASLTDTTFKFDMRDQSFDSRTGSGYIDCVFNVGTPLQFVKQDPKESSSSHLSLQKDDNLDSSYPDHGRVECDDFSCGSLQEEAVPSSSYVTWDEKTEIVEPESQNCDSDEALHILQTDYGQNIKEFVDSTRNVGRDNISMDNENTLTFMGGSQLDDIESETDNYMDALNTIESESENDFDCQTKREVEQCTSNSTTSVIEGRIHEITPLESEHHPSNFESHATSVKSLNKDMSIPDIVSLERISHDDSLQISGVSSEQDNLPGNVFSESICDGSKSEAVTRDLSSSPGSKIPYQQHPTNSTNDSQESPAEISGTRGVQFWTNGGLLGLEPSKPPDCRVSNGVNHNLASESKMDTFPSGHNAASHCLSIRQLRETTVESKQQSSSTLCHENQEDASNIDKSLGKGLTNRVNDRLFGLDHRLLVNGFRRKPSLLHDRTNETAKILNSGPFEHNSALHTVVNDPGDGSSPPLELMKISFQPINGGFENSKLKLKFHDGTHIQEVTRDMFPSFQLVPDPILLLHKNGSDSNNDDTFCRSSPISDDCMSHHSESSSEQWESSETPRSKDQEIYGALSRISSVESISSSHELDGKLDGSILDNRIQSPHAANVVESSLLFPVFNIPSFDTVQPSIKMSPDPEISSVWGCPKDPTPPPPLPPMQWRILKSHSDMAEDKQDFVADGLTNAFDIKQLQSTVTFDQPKPESFNPQQVIAFDMKQLKSAIPLESSVSTPKSKQENQQKLSGQQRAADRAANGKGLDEKEDFLQQIRTQSFNLRPTFTERPTISPVPPTNVKVTAILEKAIAIRQAVGSDDGEDNDTWSDA